MPKRKQQGASKIYGDNKTVVVTFRCPESKKDDFKAKAYLILDSYVPELIKHAQDTALSNSSNQSLNK